jgi:hydroxyethylthiazole kinase-like uncharacterized protein yjeF
MVKKTVTVKQIQKIDDLAINRYGVQSLALMETAGRLVAEEIIAQLKNNTKKHVSIFCGLGNNAGDGFVIARYLINAEIKVNIFLIGKEEGLKEDALVNYRVLEKMRCPINSCKIITKKILNSIATSDVVVDAIFGVGLSRTIENPFKNVIEAINEHAKKIIAVDIPSGLNGTTGKVYGVCINANKTVTFSFAKKGFMKNEGPSKVGKVVVVDIGIPKIVKKRVLR